jgi:hypothetical protein
MRIPTLFLLSLALSTNLFAQDIKIVGTITQALKVPQNKSFYMKSQQRTDTNKTINEIKAALNEKDRVTFAVLLLDFDLGTMGAVGTHNAQFDTWVLTPEIARDIYSNPLFGGHEMVITGYDDDAVATDAKGRQHKGLFTLRNSWGEQYGDKGNFYMSYDYFKVLVIEAQRIRNLPSEIENPNPDTATV